MQTVFANVTACALATAVFVMAGCGDSGKTEYKGILDSGSYTLKEANTKTTYEDGSIGFQQYTGMTGRLDLSNGGMRKKIVYRGYSSVYTRKFGCAYVNQYIGTFGIYSSNAQKVKSGSYNILTSETDFHYDSYILGNITITYNEKWIKE